MLSTLFLGMVVVSGCSDAVSVAPEDPILTPVFSLIGGPGKAETPLYAGQTNLVGKVTVEVAGPNLEVTYIVNAPNLLCETHLAVATSLEGIPQTRTNNPVPGRFPFGDDFDPCIGDPVSYSVPIPDGYISNTGLFIAAHAVVALQRDCDEGDVEGFISEFPSEANVCVVGSGTGTSFYFDEVVLTEAGILNGTYGAWCVDLDRIMRPPACFDALVLPAVEPFDQGDFDFMLYPENLPKVNWILNQSFLGENLGNTNLVTFGDIQRAIWLLLEDPMELPDQGTAPWDDDNVNAIIDMASENGDFFPGCGEYIGVVLDGKPEEGFPEGRQPIIIPKEIECLCTADDTAWGFGTRFTPQGNWAWYFQFKIS